MRGARTALLLLLLAQLSLAIVIENPKLVRSMRATVMESGTITAIGGSMSYLELNVTIPQNSSYQRITYVGRLVTDEEGNQLANIRVSNPSNPYPYSVESHGDFSARTTDSLPATYVVPPEYAPYLAPGPKVQSNDPEIRRLAEELTENATDDWERVARLAIWVNGAMEYDPSLIGREKDALWVLANKRGVCVEYTTLYMALARSIGIPTRFVSGYAYGEYGWLGHSWAESYIGEWVPVDPTWLEVGHVDATHIEKFRSHDNRAESAAIALMTPGASLEWKRALLGADADVRVSSVDEEKPDSGYELFVGSETLSFGDETVVVARVPGSDYRVVDLSLVPCSGPEQAILLESPQKQVAILRPGRDSYVIWKLRANPALSPHFIYTCPLTLHSGYLERRTLNMRITPEPVERTLFVAWLAKSNVLMGEQQTIYYSVSRVGYNGRIAYAYEGGEGSAQILAPGTASFSFTPRHPGLNTVYVYSNSGGVVELPFIVSENASLYVMNFTAPRRGLVGGMANVIVLVRNDGASARKMKVTVSIGNATASRQASVLGEQSFNISVPLREAGPQNVTVRLESNSLFEEESAPIEVLEPPAVRIEGIDFAWVGSETTVILRLNATGEPKMMNITINGRTMPVQPGEVSVSSPPGDRKLLIEWQDAFGNRYNLSKSVSVPERPATTPMSTPLPGPAPCPLALAIAAFLVAGCGYLFKPPHQ